MSAQMGDSSQNVLLKNVDSLSGGADFDLEDFDFSKLPERPRNLKIEKQRSLNERSLTESAFEDFDDDAFSPIKRSALDTLSSESGAGADTVVSKAWECLRSSLVYFMGQPVGTKTTLHNSDESLNHDQTVDSVSGDAVFDLEDFDFSKSLTESAFKDFDNDAFSPIKRSALDFLRSQSEADLVSGGGVLEAQMAAQMGDSVSGGGVLDLEDYDFSKLLERPRNLKIEKQRSLNERSLTQSAFEDFEDDAFSPIKRSALDTLSSESGADANTVVSKAWEILRLSLVFFMKQPVGTISTLDNFDENLNCDQVSVRDFVPTALALLLLMNQEPEIVKNFLLTTIGLQSLEKNIDRFQLGEGVMPASFKVVCDPVTNTETLEADFGESAIGRGAPVDSGFWWIILLRAYTRATGDTTLAESPECQKGMRLILSSCLSEGFDKFPTLLCADGCCMIDRQMGVYGYPIEIQALFFMALRCALVLLEQDTQGKELVEKIVKRLRALSHHMRNYFWLDMKQLNSIFQYKTEEYSHTAVNKLNVMPDSLPEWIFDFMPTHGGYFLGNVGPSYMDFRWFCLGNCMAILSSLATPYQETAIMDLIESRWEELVGCMPLKACYPAIEGHEWRMITGSDPKNTQWSYHNGGSWPVLLWVLTAACIKTGRPQIASRAIEVAETCLSEDCWPEYYDDKLGTCIGKQARQFQTCSITGYLLSRMLLADPSCLGMISLEQDSNLKPDLRRSASWS